MKYALVVVGLVVAGCGDDGTPHGTDAGPHADAAPRPDAGDPCDYHEHDDSGNGTTAEATGLTLDGELRLCGTIHAHAPDPGGVIDTDVYGVTIPTDMPVLVRLVSAEGAALGAMRVSAGGSIDTVESALLRGVHAAFVASAHAGTLELAVEGENADAPAAEVPYELRVLVDEPDTRCATVAGPPSYVEQSDGATNVQNDVFHVAWPTDTVPAVTLTTDPLDAPEASGPSLTISAGMNYAATGSHDTNPTAGADDYMDRDTYVIAAGSETNEMTVRVSWAYDASTDLDFLLFPALGATTEVPPPLAIGAAGTRDVPELQTTSVLPSTTYWLWVASYNGSTVPMAYTITLCGATFTP